MDQHKEENEKKKEYLRRYHAAELAEREIREEIDDLRMNKMFPALIQDGMPHGSSCGDLSAYVVQLEELMDNLKAQMEQQIRLRKEITQKIEEMPDETEKTVLRLRYIRWLQWEQIAERMGYSLRNITKIHGKALAHFET